MALKGIKKRLGDCSIRDRISLLRLLPQCFAMPLPGVQMTSIKFRHHSTTHVGLWLSEEQHQKIACQQPINLNKSGW